MVYHDDELDVFGVYHVARPTTVVRTSEYTSSSHKPDDHHDERRLHHHPQHHHRHGENALPAAALAFSGALGSAIANLAVFPLEVIVKQLQTQRHVHYSRSRRRSSKRRPKHRTRASSTSSSSSQHGHSRRTRSRGGSPSRPGVEREGYSHRKGDTYALPSVEVIEHEEGGERVTTTTTTTSWEHYESSEEYHEGFFETIEKIYAKDGISGFYTGAVEETLGVMSGTFMHIMIHHYLRNKRLHHRHTKKLPVIEEILIGIAASSVAKFISTPFSTVVTRKQTHAMLYPYARPASIGDIFHDIMQEKGITGFWSGYSASFLMAVNPTITFLLYEGLKKGVGGKRRELKGGETFLIAAVSKAIATGITYPLAVAKSRIQMQSDEDRRDFHQMGHLDKAVKKGLERKIKANNNVVHVLVDILRREGIASLYEGVMVEIFRGFVSNGISILIKESVHRTILSVYYFVMRAYNRTDDYTFKSTTKVIAKDAYDHAGPKRKKLMDKTAGGVGVVGSVVESGKSRVAGVIEEGRETVGHIKDKVVGHVPFVGKHRQHTSSEGGHHMNGKVKMGAAFAAGAAAAHLKSAHDRQERRDQQESHRSHGSHGRDVVHTKRERVEEWRDGVNDSLSSAAVHNKFGRTAGHLGHAVGTVGVSDSRHRVEGGVLESRVSDHRHAGLVENVDVRELGDDRIHTGETMVIGDYRHGRGHDELVDSRTHIEKTTVRGGHDGHGRSHGHSHSGLARVGLSSHHTGHKDLVDVHTGRASLAEGHSFSGLGDARNHLDRSSHHGDHDRLVDTRIVTKKTSVHEAQGRGHGHGEHSHSHSHSGHASPHAGKFTHQEGLVDSRVDTGRFKTHEGHIAGGLTDSRAHAGKYYRHDDSVESRVRAGKVVFHGDHDINGAVDSRLHAGRSSHRVGHDGVVDTRIVKENTVVRESHGGSLDSQAHVGEAVFREGHSTSHSAGSRFDARKSPRPMAHDGLVDTRIVTKETIIHEGHDGIHDSSRFGGAMHSNQSGHDMHKHHGPVMGAVSNAVAVGAAVGSAVGSAVKRAVTGRSSHYDHEDSLSHSHQREHGHGHGHGRGYGHHGREGEEVVVRREETVEWRDDKHSNSDIHGGHDRRHARSSSAHGGHRTGISSDSHSHLEAGAAHHGHRSRASHLGGHHDGRIVKETRIIKYSGHPHADRSLNGTGFLTSEDDYSEVFHDARSRASGPGDSTMDKRVVVKEECTRVGNSATMANDGALKVTHVEKGWDIDGDSRTEVYNFMEEKEGLVTGANIGGKAVMERKSWDSPRGKGYR